MLRDDRRRAMVPRATSPLTVTATLTVTVTVTLTVTLTLTRFHARLVSTRSRQPRFCVEFTR